jgi:hypothetical protein
LKGLGACPEAVHWGGALGAEGSFSLPAFKGV